MASVRKTQKSPFWLADIRIWMPSDRHRNGGYWSDTTRSTKVPVSEPKSKALKVAQEIEAIENEAKKTILPTKQFFESRVAALMRAAGVEPPHKSASWIEFSKQWLAEHDAGEKSLKKYTGEIKQFTDFLGSKSRQDMRIITPKIFEDFYRGLLSSGLAAGTARGTCKTIRAVFTKAVKMHFLDDNPGGLTRLKSGEETIRQPYTLEDIAAIAKALRQSKPAFAEWRIACLFGLYYGLRLGDAISRDFSEIHIENGVKVIRFVPEKKKAKRAEIALPLLGELAGLERGEGKITPRLASYGNPSRTYTETILKQSGILINRRYGTGRGRNVNAKTFHSWRHTANSLLASVGVDARVRQLICDHDDPRTNDRYTHANVETMAKAIQKATAGLVI